MCGCVDLLRIYIYIYFTKRDVTRILSAHLVNFRYTAGIFRCIAKFRTTTINFVMYDGPSVRLHGTTLLPMPGIS